MKKPHEIAQQYMGKSYDLLDKNAQLVARQLAERKPISRNLSLKKTREESTFGERAADAVARFGGSWAFIGLFAAVLLGWVILNSFILAGKGNAFDPYPYILLNLFLSMLASIQAPVILMSQNRQGEKDRLNAEHDYEINLKAELEILLLHEKMDVLREQQWAELIALQKEQIALLKTLTAQNDNRPPQVSHAG